MHGWPSAFLGHTKPISCSFPPSLSASVLPLPPLLLFYVSPCSNKNLALLVIDEHYQSPIMPNLLSLTLCVHLFLAFHWFRKVFLCHLQIGLVILILSAFISLATSLSELDTEPSILEELRIYFTVKSVWLLEKWLCYTVLIGLELAVWTRL